MPDSVYFTDEELKSLILPANHTTHFHRSGSPECLPGATCCAIDSLAREVLAGRRLREAAEEILKIMDADGDEDGFSGLSAALSAYPPPAPQKEA